MATTGRYVSHDNDSRTRTVHEIAAEHIPDQNGHGTPEQVDQYVLNNSAAHFLAGIVEQAKPGRRAGGRLRRATGRSAAMRDAAVTDRLELALSRTRAAFVAQLSASLLPSLNVPEKAKKLKLLSKTLIVLAELIVLGATYSNSLDTSPAEGWLSAAGISVALLSIPWAAAFARRVMDSQLILKQREVPRLLADRALRYQFDAVGVRRVWLFLCLYILVILGFAFRVGTIVNHGDLVGLFVVVTSIGVGVLEFRFGSIDIAVHQQLENDLKAAFKTARRRDRGSRATLPKFASTNAHLVLSQVSLQAERRGRAHRAKAESLAAGGVASQDDPAHSFPVDKVGNLSALAPISWSSDYFGHKQERDVDLALVGPAYVSRLEEELTRSLEMVKPGGE